MSAEQTGSQHTNEHTASTTTYSRKMGIKRAANLLYVTKEVSLKGLKEVARTRLGQDEHVCCIDVDCSWVAHRLLGQKVPAESLGQSTAEVLHLFAKAGFIVSPICDPPGQRHHTKRDSLRRIVEKEKARINAIVKRYNIAALTQKLRNEEGLMTAEEKDDAQKQLAADIASAKTLDRKCESGGVPISFIEDLKDALMESDAHNENEHQCYVGKVIVSSFQADSIIAKRAIQKKVI